MSFSFWRSINNKIILLASLAFIVLLLSENIFLYYQLKEQVHEQVKDFTSSSFYSFGSYLDQSFYRTEDAGKQYKDLLMEHVAASKTLAELEASTAIFLAAHPSIIELSVIANSEPNSANLPSYFCYNNFFNTISATDSSVFRTAMLQFIKRYSTDSTVSSFWTSPYTSLVSQNSPLITTLFVPIISPQAGNKLSGVISLSIAASDIERRLSFYTLGDNSLNVLLDYFGKIIIHPHSQFNLNKSEQTVTIEKDLVSLYENYQHFKVNSASRLASLSTVDSISNFKCPNSLALSYHLHNGWQIVTVFYKNSLPISLNTFSSILVSITILVIVLFFIILTAIINKTLQDINLITSTIASWNKYDIHDWHLPSIRSGSDFSLFVNTFNELYSDYRLAQNKLVESLMQNEKLMNNELKIESRIKQAVEEETVDLATRNKLLDLAFENVTDLNELGKIISGSLSLEAISRSVFAKLAQLVPINFFGVLIFNKATNTLNCKSGVLNGDLVPPFTIHLAEKNNIAIKCWERNDAIFINNFELEYMNYLMVSSSYNPLDVSMASQYYAPISDNDGQIGVFTLQSVYKGLFKDFNLDILAILHTYLSISIKNILSFEELQESISALNATQTKLIISEKMASMGQLAAGISHEIKNPLNFVINFSELTNLLIGDIKAEIQEFKAASDADKDKSLSIIEDLIGNMQLNVDKIAEHSKRADKIIKGMLQLSRGKSGEFMPVQINDLIMEYTKLAYHGLRATNPLFHVDITYNLDENLDKVNVVSHDISRVIINIVGNACAATFQKHSASKVTTKPEVIVTTKNLDKQFAIIVRDNGTGIPEENIDKVFNPFFTTKPSGEGTGLGLAISYDIVVVEHSGEISFETKENEFTEFKIVLPKHIW